MQYKYTVDEDTPFFEIDLARGAKKGRAKDLTKMRLGP